MKQCYPVILTFLLAFCGLATVEAQDYALDRIYKQGYPQINDYQSQNVVFYFYDFQSENLDLRHFRLSNPVLRLLLPKQVKVKLPPLKWAKDTTYAAAYVTNGEAKDGSLILMIVGNSSTNHPTFFIDSNLDHDFSDEKPIVFANENKKSKAVSIRDRFDKEKKYDFMLLNPAYQEEIKVVSQEVPKDEEELIAADLLEELPQNIKKNNLFNIKKFNNKSFYMSLNGFIGTGKLRYQYETPIDYYPFVTYELNYIPKGFALELGYIYKNIQLNFVGTYENMFYYTSTLDESYTPFIDAQGVTVFPGKTLTNIDLLSKNKYSYGLDIGYNINMGEKFALYPFLQYTQYDFEENYYNADIRKEDHFYALNQRYAVGGGITMKMMISPRSLITYRVVYQYINFDPTGFFPASSEVENFELEMEQVLIGIGYSLKLF
ncbi:MAG: hypothetical protein R3E32_00915 [Chitinophagales bacterium]